MFETTLHLQGDSSGANQQLIPWPHRGHIVPAAVRITSFLTNRGTPTPVRGLVFGLLMFSPCSPSKVGFQCSDIS